MIIVASRHLLNRHTLAVLVRCIESHSAVGLILLERPSEAPPSEPVDVMRSLDPQSAQDARRVLSSFIKDDPRPQASGSGGPWPPPLRRRPPLKISATRARR